MYFCSRVFLVGCVCVLLRGTFAAAHGDNLYIQSPLSIVSSAAPYDSSRGDTSSLNIETAIVASDTGRVLALNKMLVVANREQYLLGIPQSLSIIRPDEWLGTNKSVADIIAEQAGVQTRRYGGTGSFQTVSIRGIPGSKVLVLLDGIPLNSAMGDAVDLGALDPERFSSIEIYKGTIPALYGGNALGGAINLTSKAASAGKSVHTQAAFGSYGYRKYGVELNHSFSNTLNVFGSLGCTMANNKWPYLDRNKTPYSATDDLVRTVENHAFSGMGTRLHSTLTLPNDRLLTGGIAFSTSRLGIPAPEGSINRTAFHEQDLLHASTCLKREPPSFSSVHVTPHFGYLRWANRTFWTNLDECMGTSHGSISNRPNSWGESRSVFDAVDGSCTFNIHFSNTVTGQILTKGRYSHITTATQSSGFPHGDWPGSRLEVLVAADLGSTVSLGNVTIGGNAGGSLQCMRSSTEGGRNEVLEITVPPSDTISLPWAAHGGIFCGREKLFTMFLNIGRYSNVPSLREKYGTNGTVIPNPELKEEIAYSTEAGVRLLRPKAWFELVAFRVHSIDGIVMLSDGNMTKPVNLAEAMTMGMEFNSNWHPISLLRIDSRLTIQKAENRFHLYNYYGKRLPNEPDITWLGRVTMGPFWFFEPQYWIDYQSPFYRDYANTQKIPENNPYGRIFHNVRLSWKPLKSLILTFSMRNITAQSLRYEEIVVPPESGYSWILYPANEWVITGGYSF